MSNSKVSITGKQLLIVFFMGLAFAVVYATPFVQYVFYDDLAGALHATNTQLGFLIAIFGIGNLLAPFGGALSDKFNTKKVYLLGMFITCALNFLLAMNMSYTFAIFIWAGLAVAGLILYFPIYGVSLRPGKRYYQFYCPGTLCQGGGGSHGRRGRIKGGHHKLRGSGSYCNHCPGVPAA